MDDFDDGLFGGAAAGFDLDDDADGFDVDDGTWN